MLSLQMQESEFRRELLSVQLHASSVETIRSAPLRNQVRTLSQALASGQLDFSQLGLEHLVRLVGCFRLLNSCICLRHTGRAAEPSLPYSDPGERHDDSAI